MVVKGGVEPYSKCPFSNHQSQQRIQWNHTANVHLATTSLKEGIQILWYHISVDAVIRDKILNTQNNEFFNWKQKLLLKKLYRKRKRKPPHNISVLLKIVCCWKGVYSMALSKNMVVKGGINQKWSDLITSNCSGRVDLFIENHIPFFMSFLAGGPYIPKFRSVFFLTFYREIRAFSKGLQVITVLYRLKS